MLGKVKGIEIEKCERCRQMTCEISCIFSFRKNTAGESIDTEEDGYNYEEDIQKMHVLFEAYLLYTQVHFACKPEYPEDVFQMFAPFFLLCV
jgi:hypothetical protein